MLWTDDVGVEIFGNNLTKTEVEEWNAGAASSNPLAGDGFLETVAIKTGTRRAFGLTAGVPWSEFE